MNNINGFWQYFVRILPEFLPGKIVGTFGDRRHYRIKSLIPSLLLSDGTSSDIFVAFGHDVYGQDSLSIGDYVKFIWDKPGHRGQIKDSDRLGDPRAVSVITISIEQATELKNEIEKQLEEEIKYFSLKQLEQERENFSSKSREEKEKLDAYALDLDKKDKLLTVNLEATSETKKQIQNEFKALEIRENKLQAYNILIEDDSSSDISDRLSDNHNFPKNIGEQWKTILEQNGLSLPRQIANSYLLYLISALILGKLVLLNGNVGVGKTSIIEKSSQILGGTNKIIPVRPAWLDPSDILGFYNPIHKIFRPASYLTSLKQANKAKDRLHLVCLDEINLAKMENYGADLLSCLEYSRNQNKTSPRGLLLYSKDIYELLKEECRYLYELDLSEGLQTEKKIRLTELQKLFQEYPSNEFYLADNLVLLGTFNSDESSYDLSPKLIDRSFVITYPPAQLGTLEGNAISNISKAIISINKFKEIYEQKLSLSIEQEVKNNWSKIIDWNRIYLCGDKLGRPLGHRATQDFKTFNLVAQCTGLSTEDCFASFIFTKILPRIYFFKNYTEDDKKQQSFKNWLRELKDYQKYDSANILDSLQEQLKNNDCSTVSYWG